VFTGLARAKSIPTKTYSNEVVTLWCVLKSSQITSTAVATAPICHKQTEAHGGGD